MELILKRPINKAPCICIKFGSSYEAGKFHCILPNEYSMHPFSVKLEIKRNNTLDLSVIVEGFKIPFLYKNVQYNAEKLNRFILETAGSESYNFCHIITQTNKDMVVQTSIKRVAWVIKIRELELIKEY